MQRPIECREEREVDGGICVVSDFGLCHPRL